MHANEDLGVASSPVKLLHRTQTRHIRKPIIPAIGSAAHWSKENLIPFSHVIPLNPRHSAPARRLQIRSSGDLPTHSVHPQHAIHAMPALPAALAITSNQTCDTAAASPHPTVPPKVTLHLCPPCWAPCNPPPPPRCPYYFQQLPPSQGGHSRHGPKWSAPLATTFPTQARAILSYTQSAFLILL